MVISARRYASLIRLAGWRSSGCRSSGEGVVSVVAFQYQMMGKAAWRAVLGCGDIDWYEDGTGGLCHSCLYRAELLAAEAGGQ